MKQILLFVIAVLCNVTASAQRGVDKAVSYDLVYMRHNQLYVANQSEWSKLKDKHACQPIGIVLEDDDDEKFVAGIRDWFDILDGYRTWNSLHSAVGEWMPTEAEAYIISNDLQLRDIARQYLGSDPFGNYYWTDATVMEETSDAFDLLEYIFGLPSSKPTTRAYIFCPGIPDAPYTECEKDDASNNGFMDVYRNLDSLTPDQILTPAKAIGRLEMY